MVKKVLKKLIIVMLLIGILISITKQTAGSFKVIGIKI